MSGTADPERVYDVHEIATLLHVSDMTVRRRIRSGEIPSYRVGRAHQVQEAALHAYFDKIGFLLTGT